MNQLDPAELLAQAQARTGLTDFGPDMFRQPLEVLTRSMREEARLNAVGLAVQSERLVNALANRLRRIELMQRHPEIAGERVEVGMVIAGLPRTGSTLLQRLLAATPQTTAPFWWETIYPLPHGEPGRADVAQRKADAEALAAQLVAHSAGLEAIHPMDAHAHDEDLLLIEQTFVSNVPEAMVHVPGYGAWLAGADQRWSYAELVDWLKILQWQDPARRGRKWVLKSPHHLTAVGTVLETFPEAVIVMTHRRVEHVLGSYYSMVAALTGGNTDADFAHAQAAHWTAKLRANLAAMMQARETAPGRFLDVYYDKLIPAPFDHARRIFAAAGLTPTPADEASWATWMAANQRDNRPSHRYDVRDYGIAPEVLRQQFAFYIDAFGLDG
jgi:LPS sulfotransferase NodH